METLQLSTEVYIDEQGKLLFDPLHDGSFRRYILGVRNGWWGNSWALLNP